MSVRCACPSCRKTLSIPAGVVGKKVRCPGCQAVVAVRASGGKTALALAGVTSSARAQQTLPVKTKTLPSAREDVEEAEATPTRKRSRAWMWISLAVAGMLLLGLGAGTLLWGIRHAARNIRQNDVDMSFAAFGTQRPKEGARVRVGCMLSGGYAGVYENCRSTHYAFFVSIAPRTERAYVPKDSPLGKRMYELCKDGQWHPITLRLQHVGPDGKPTTPEGNADGIAILDIVRDH